MHRESTDRVPRWIAIVICIASLLACAGYAWFRQSLPVWWRDHGGGIPYVAFWICFAFTTFPRKRWIVRICIAAVAMTCLLEVLQLWQPPWLVAFRATRFGVALLGASFHWNDFPPYFIGGFVGYGVLFWGTLINANRH